MPQALAPYLDLAKDTGLALTDADFAYGLLINATALLSLAGVLALVGLIATHGKSHGTRFTTMALFVFASLAGLGAWLIRPEAAAGTLLGTMLPWAWVPAFVAAMAMFVTLPEKPKPRAIGLALSLLIAVCATVFGGMLAVANTRALHPDAMTWLDAPPIESIEKIKKDAEEKDTRPVLDTAHPEKKDNDQLGLAPR